MNETLETPATHTPEGIKQAHQEPTREFTMNVSDAVVRTIKYDTGKSISELQEQPLDERRREAAKDYGTMVFPVNYPVLGRGNLLRERTLSHEEIERRFERASKSIGKSAENRADS
jgi:hypothetical protein